MIKAVIFDFDGVIIDSEPVHEEAWSIFLKKYSVQFNETMKMGFKGRTAKENLKRTFGEYKYGEDEINIMAHTKQSIYRDILKHKIKLVNGVERFLEDLVENEYKTALATSSVRKNLELVFSLFSLKKYFNIIVTSEEVKKGKPDPEIFLTAANKLSVNPSECVVFEDSLTGVEGAKRAGMKVVFVATSFKLDQAPSVDLAINDFMQISVDQIKQLP